MKQMVNDFSEYARAPAMQIVAFDLNRLVTEVTDLYRSQEASVELVTRLGEAMGAVEADRSRIRQVLNNLLTNAFEALEGIRPATIEVRTAMAEWEGGVFAELTVSDNGPGFQPDMIDRVFDPYVTSKPRGTGLGLAIVKKIVEDHKGRIEVGNRPSGGAMVRVMFPVLERERALAPGTEHADRRRERA
jgi:nitrogen fixation/metabolism regulation signal transduction histidine kinase